MEFKNSKEGQWEDTVGESCTRLVSPYLGNCSESLDSWEAVFETAKNVSQNEVKYESIYSEIKNLKAEL